MIYYILFIFVILIYPITFIKIHICERRGDYVLPWTSPLHDLWILPLLGLIIFSIVFIICYFILKIPFPQNFIPAIF